MTPIQCRAARALLGWSQTKLGDEAGFHFNIVHRFETGRRTEEAIVEWFRERLEEAGIEFIDDNGVILRREGTK